VCACVYVRACTYTHDIYMASLYEGSFSYKRPDRLSKTVVVINGRCIYV